MHYPTARESEFDLAMFAFWGYITKFTCVKQVLLSAL